MLGLDTSAVISILRNDKRISDLIARHNEKLVITDIVLFELLKGLPKRIEQKQLIEQLLLQVDCLSTTKSSAYIAAKIFNNLQETGQQIDEEDCLIAGIFLDNNITTIISENRKHFSKIPGLSIISY